MNKLDLLGLIAGFCTMSAAVPQLVKAMKTKKVNDVSPFMFAILVVGVGLWIIYGIVKKDLAITVTNSLSFLLNILTLTFLIRYRKGGKWNN